MHVVSSRNTHTINSILRLSSSSLFSIPTIPGQMGAAVSFCRSTMNQCKGCVYLSTHERAPDTNMSSMRSDRADKASRQNIESSYRHLSEFTSQIGVYFGQSTLALKLVLSLREPQKVVVPSFGLTNFFLARPKMDVSNSLISIFRQ